MMTKRTIKGTKPIYIFHSPIVMKLLNELGASLLTKNGLFGLKRYYKIESKPPE